MEQKEKVNYDAPCVEVMEIKPKFGFVFSPDATSEDANDGGEW